MVFSQIAVGGKLRFTKLSKEERVPNDQPMTDYSELPEADSTAGMQHEVDNTWDDNDKPDPYEHSPVVLRRVEDELRRMAESFRQKRLLVCSEKPTPRCIFGR